MTDRPILMSAPMIRALLDGRKTQTRELAWRGTELGRAGLATLGHQPEPTIWQSVKPGDRLWVKETWRTHAMFDHIKPRDLTTNSIHYDANSDPPTASGKTRVSIHMTRRISRLTLLVTATKMEGVKEISEKDAVAEGNWPPPSVRQLRQDTTWISGQCRDCRFAVPRDELVGSKIRGCAYLLGDTRDEILEFMGQGCWDFQLRSDDTAEPPRLRFKYLWDSLHYKPGEHWHTNPEVVALTFTVHQCNIDAMDNAQGNAA